MAATELARIGILDGALKPGYRPLTNPETQAVVSDASRLLTHFESLGHEVDRLDLDRHDLEELMAKVAAARLLVGGNIGMSRFGLAVLAAAQLDRVPAYLFYERQNICTGTIRVNETPGPCGLTVVHYKPNRPNALEYAAEMVMYSREPQTVQTRGGRI